jgi:hypothetical protein
LGFAENMAGLRKTIPESIRIVAVSKTLPSDAILSAYQGGYRIFGENKAMELAEKHQQLPSDIEWHFIGHLQTNKVKNIASFVTLIHSVDSSHLLQEINKEALKNDRNINCLLQFHIASEETKFGLNMEEASDMLRAGIHKSCMNVHIIGVMGMASFTEDSSLIRKEFKMLHQYFTCLKTEFFSNEMAFKEISMGMSGDYQIAIEEGSTMVRIGTLLFGNRLNH